MLPTNVMSFMKKMVAPEDAPAQNTPENTGGTFGKLKQTLSSSLLTAQDKVTKMSPRPSLVPDTSDTSAAASSESSLTASAHTITQQQQHQNSGQKVDPAKPPSRAGACRVCLKSFKPDDYSRTCFECQQRVCEDCASYADIEDVHTWRCSVCRRKMASRVCIPQDSTDSMLDVPVLEALQRRHSDVKLGSSVQLSTGNGLGLAPPRSPELRRHSDVSPASLKELEKLKGTKTPNDEFGKGRSTAPSRSSSPPRRGDFDVPPIRIGSRRQSRVGRQHSYDDEIKIAGPGGGSQTDLGLGIPTIPRRASAYDVFAPGILAAAAQAAGAAVPSRRASFRIAPADDMPQNDNSPSPDNGSPVLMVEEDRRMRRRGSQLPDIAALRDRGALPTAINLTPAPFQPPALEDLEAPRRQTSMDGEAIKIVIHDVDSGPICASKRRVVLRRDPTDKAHRTRGFGMRVVGGKTGADGRLFAYIVWTVPGGPAEKGGLQQGDKILEWNGVSLIDRSFEEVCSIMDRTGDVVDLLVEHATDFRMCDLLDDNVPPGAGGNQSGPRKSGGDATGLGLVPDTESTDKSPSSPTRRKLPKTPITVDDLHASGPTLYINKMCLFGSKEQIAREKQVSGRVQLQVWYHSEKSELVVSLMAADDLAPRDENYGFGMHPEAYAKVKILPKTGDGHVAQTEVSAPTQNPIWNATLSFANVSPDNLMDRFVEIQLWDLVPHTESIFLGETNVDLQKAFLDDRAIWYRLEDPRNLRSGSMNRSPSVSPRGSISVEHNRYGRRNDYLQRSISDDVDSIGDGTSLLHPDHAWVAGSRRGSSQSETLEVEVYQLGKDFSRSLPGSRRSSFQDREQQQDSKDGEATPPPVIYLNNRRRSSCVRRDPDEILKSLKAVKGELGRTMSLSAAEKRPTSRRSSRARKDSVVEISERTLGMVTNKVSPPVDERPAKWKGSGSLAKNLIIAPKEPYVVLGPGQIQPKGYRLTSGRYGELKLGFFKIKGTIEVEVICARNIVNIDCETPPDTYVKCYLKDGDRLRHKKKTRVVRHAAEPLYKQTLKYQVICARNIVNIDCETPPDTYVKCYLKDGDRLRHKKKTRVVRHAAEPLYKQTLKYQTADVFGRNLVIMVWQRCVGFEHNQGLGGAELSLDKLNLAQHLGGWYPLFPMHSFGSDSNDSP